MRGKVGFKDPLLAPGGFYTSDARGGLNAINDDMRNAARTRLSRPTPSPSPHPRPLASLALHHSVALLQQALALAVLALRPLLDVRAFQIVHVRLQIAMREAPLYTGARARGAAHRAAGDSKRSPD